MKTWSCFFSLYHILWRALCYWYKTRNLAVGKRHRLMKRRARCVWRNRHLKKSTPPQYSTIFFCFFFFTFPLFSFIFKYRPSISLLPFFHQLCGIGSFVICFIFFWKKMVVVSFGIVVVPASRFRFVFQNQETRVLILNDLLFCFVVSLILSITVPVQLNAVLFFSLISLFVLYNYQLLAAQYVIPFFSGFSLKFKF